MIKRKFKLYPIETKLNLTVAYLVASSNSETKHIMSFESLGSTFPAEITFYRSLAL